MTPIPILALIPAFNEARRIVPVIRAAQAHLPVLVVDDGSSDETAQTAEAAGAVVLRQVPNQGKGAALRAGFHHALAQGCQAVLTLDADGQHDPAEIPAFLAAHRATGADLVIGARDFTRMPFTRRLANTLGQGIFSWALGQPVRDNQSGYRLISRRLVEAVLESQEQGFEFEVEMIVTCTRRQFRMEWVPIQTIYRDQGSHIRPIQHMINFFRLSWKTYQSRKTNQT
jgi:glycosyltransferase involved in cell wall biosynthesis